MSLTITLTHPQLSELTKLVAGTRISQIPDYIDLIPLRQAYKSLKAANDTPPTPSKGQG